jgi:hypothetical protein
MQIVILHGTEKRLYDLVAPLVMDPAVLRQNHNVAFKTSPKFVWVVAIDEGVCVGFLPIQQKKEVAEINNYHVKEHSHKILSAMLKKAEQQAKDAKYADLIVIAHNVDAPVFKRKGFSVAKVFVNYTWFVKQI